MGGLVPMEFRSPNAITPCRRPEGGKEDPEPRERERGMEERDRERDAKREGRRGARISGAEGQSMGPGEEESRRHAEGGLGSK